jgi:hypothetical protein
LKGGALAWILGNWSTNFIQSIRSGQPWNPRIHGDLANVGRSDDYMRPNALGNPNLDHPTTAQWVNTSAFAIPEFAYGNVGRNSFRSAPVFNTDFSVFKEFHLSERTLLEFRAEAFNIFNIMSYGPPIPWVDQPDFGIIDSVAEFPRQFQFGLKLSF